jgi:hypothetical protein
VDNSVRNARIGVARLVFVISLSIASVIPAQTSSDAKRFDAISNYWEWSSYFGINGLDFPATQYRNGLSFSALVFYDDFPVDRSGGGYSKAYWGFCSAEIGTCQSYAASSDGAVDFAHGIRIQRGETEELALARFRSWEFAEGPIRSPTVSKAQPSSEGAGKLPTIDPGIGGRPVQPDQFTIRTLRRKITLPAIGIPSAVKRKVSNSKAESEVRKFLFKPNSRSGCTIVVPYADDRVAKLPVLVECPKNSSITIVSKRGDEWFFTHGGLVEDKSTIDRLAPHIRASASLTLRE